MQPLSAGGTVSSEHRANMDPDWGKLAPSLRAAYLPEVEDRDVQRLRQRVAERTASAARGRRVGPAWAAAAAAALALAAIGLVGWSPVSGLGSSTTPAAFEVSVTPNGETMFEFDDDRGVHRIVKSTCLDSSDNQSVLYAEGKRFVEPNGAPEPGTAFFYRVD